MLIKSDGVNSFGIFFFKMSQYRKYTQRNIEYIYLIFQQHQIDQYIHSRDIFVTDIVSHEYGGWGKKSNFCIPAH